MGKALIGTWRWVYSSRCDETRFASTHIRFDSLSKMMHYLDKGTSISKMKYRFDPESLKLDLYPTIGSPMRFSVVFQTKDRIEFRSSDGHVDAFEFEENKLQE
jgi:hypothetical protein